ncbi:cytochrome P450, putative [Ricinus communis]|uniref:Cytochrome P450, putative n=1 Tax=Ricinus communis TaxID=3988 RepID=B9RRW6_RICCO|nr:cytochrome P450, putative [Ricinus communis]|eukprot:XP_002516485.1 cytochrome P450 714A1 [Ricinus communis]
MEIYSLLLSAFGVIGFVYCFIHIFKESLLGPFAVKRKLHIQGIKGPSPSFLYGNLSQMQQIQLKTKKEPPPHDQIAALDYTSIVFPYFEHWRKQYGPVYTYSTGFKQHLYLTDPELVREMNQCNTLDLGKPPYVTKRFAPMFGNGIIRSNGHFWALQRKMVAPEFFMFKVKSMVGLMVESTKPLIREWEQRIETQGGAQAEITVDDDLKGLSANVIARACFGSSYFKGNEIFSKLRTLHKALTKHATLFGFSGFRKNYREIRSLEREIESLIWDTVQERQRQGLTERDLMQLILEEAVNNTDAGKLSPKQFIVDNCKSLYFAGHDTTAISASWCLMLLALHPDWQSQIRAEVAEFCNDELLDANSLSNLKTVTMVIQEALRLFPPAGFVVREAFEEVKIRNIIIPKGVCTWTLISTLHRDPSIWGPDADKFNPGRFADGISKACKFPQAYIPFGLGTRLCVGRNFAIVELKIVISLIVSKFRISLSPNYVHSPVLRMLVEPEHGLQLLIQKI